MIGCFEHETGEHEFSHVGDDDGDEGPRIVLKIRLRLCSTRPMREGGNEY